MKEDSDVLFVPDEDYSDLKLVGRPSYQKKLWGLLLQNSAVLRHNIRSSVSHNSTMTRPLIKVSTLVLILVSLLNMWVWYNLPIQDQCSPIVDDFKAGGNVVADPKNLTVATLLEVKRSKPFCGTMENCLDKAIKEFKSEPDIVQQNAKMILECNGTRKEFVSGKGENYIQVLWVDGQTDYTVREANLEVYVARLGHQALPLSLASILNVYQRLASHKGSEELLQCLNVTIEKFPKEPSAVQDNARLVVSCGENNLTFLSAVGKTEITVYKDMHGKITFKVKCTGWACWARRFTW